MSLCELSGSKLGQAEGGASIAKADVEPLSTEALVATVAIGICSFPRRGEGLVAAAELAKPQARVVEGHGEVREEGLGASNGELAAEKSGLLGWRRGRTRGDPARSADCRDC
jgi:hypothetical protein